ncbi:MAG: hypothetical protein Q9181_006439 [Wetmoreana brouardii]
MSLETLLCPSPASIVPGILEHILIEKPAHQKYEKQLAHQDSDESLKGVMVPRRDHSHEVYYPRRELNFDARRMPSRSRSSHSSRRRHHSRYSDSGSDTDSDSSSDEEQQRSKFRKKTLLAAGLATVTTVAAGNNIYQSTKAHQARRSRLCEERLSEKEAQELQKKGRKMDLISVGVAAVCLYNVRSGWKRWESQREEARKAQDQNDKRRKS